MLEVKSGIPRRTFQITNVFERTTLLRVGKI